MAKPTTANATKLSVWLGTDTSPQTFSKPCGFTSRGMNISATANETDVPDCDNPDDPAWVERVVKSLSAGINGSGVLAKEALDAWETFALSGIARDCRVIIDWGGGVTRRYDGRFICSNFNITGNDGDKIRIEVALLSDGQVTPTSTP